MAVFNPFKETDTFQSVTDRGATTTNPIQITSISPQLTLRYDALKSASFAATSAGYLNVVATGGRVMIGSGTPNNALEIADGIFGINRNVGSGNLSMFRFYRSGSEKMRIGIDSDDGFTVMSSGGVPRVSVTNAGSLGVGIQVPHASAILQASSTSQGFLPPIMTTAQRDAIASPLAGLVVYNSTTSLLNFYNGGSWGAI